MVRGTETSDRARRGVEGGEPERRTEHAAGIVHVRGDGAAGEYQAKGIDGAAVEDGEASLGAGLAGARGEVAVLQARGGWLIQGCPGR